MLHLHRAERADALVAALGAVVVDPLDDPMAAEVVAVPTRGVERWLSQRLSARLGATPGRADGVCANIDFPYPAALVGGAVASATGVARDADPWVAARSVWPLLEVIDAALGEPWLDPLASYLGATGADAEGDPSLFGREARRFGSARHLADLYDRYGVHRPGMLRAWAAKEDLDGAGQALRPHWSWQAELWRRLRDRIGVASPAERLDDACAALRRDATIVDLPARLSLFGLTRLPASFLAVLRALAVHRDVHLFLLHPSPVLWRRVEAETGGRAAVVPRAADTTAVLPTNPLLMSWGRDAREMQLVLTAGGDGDAAPAEYHHSIEAPERTLLQRIQADVRADRPPPGLPLAGRDDRAVLDPGDTSLAVHACHGRGRQVEVVRDAILHLLAADPTLEPRDIVVMCPDIEAFAPLIHATFGAAEGVDGVAGGARVPAGLPDADAVSAAGASGPTSVDLRVRLADRALRQTNPVLGVVAELLGLASARVTAAQVLDLAGREPIRRRFRFDDDDLARAEEWVAAAGVRWGLDAEHRAGYKLDALDANTWRAGLDRLLLGVAMAEDGQRLVGGVLPLDDVSSSDIDLAGRLAELLDRLTAALDRLSARQPIAAWAAALADAAALLTATTQTGAWQTAELRHLLDDVVAEAGADDADATPAAGFGVPGSRPSATDERRSPAELTLPEVQALLADRLRGRPTRANFRTGHLTICTLVPMRSVPHRVVCLLGLDDGVFPRKIDVDDDDLVAADSRVGDRDPRSEDRQLLLDALLAAESHLIITYSGRDERTNAERPPAVPVGELLDVVDRTVRLPDDPAGEVRARTRIVVRHPLQPFDARNFEAGRLTGVTPWSFDAIALAGARAAGGERAEAAPFLPQPLPPVRGEAVELENLVRFVQHPVKAFLRQRLGVSLSEDADDASQALPVELDALEQWGVGDRLLSGRLAGGDRDACVAAERARGTLPPGTLAEPVLGQVLPIVESLVAEAAEITAADASQVDLGLRVPTDPRSLEINVPLADGRVLLGTVAGVIDRGPAGLLLRSVSYSRLAPKQRLTAWVRFLALTAAHPDRPVEAATIGRFRFGGRKKGAVSIACLGPLAGDAATRQAAAMAHLEVLVDLFDRGLCEPLPLYCKTSAAWAEAAPAQRMQACSGVWEPQNDLGMGENREPEHQLVLGGVAPLGDLLAAFPEPGETGDGWAGGEPTRFGRYALRLWSGLLDAEEVRDR